MEKMKETKTGKETEKKKMTTGQRLINMLLELLFLAGAGILVYPTVADEWNTLRQQQLISGYNDVIEEEDPEDVAELWEAARAYNEKHGPSNIYEDVFEVSDEENADSIEADREEPEEESENGQDRMEDSGYWQVLNPMGDGIMGYISIPRINIRIPIYHGISDEVLQKGAGHLSGSQLPIGGEGNHAVLAAHRGLPSSKLFSDLDELEIGDQFYLYILDDVLAYEVDQILPMVEMDDMETISEATATVEGEDYVTLYTCTPYGVNSHRLLVRGHRVPYEGEEESTTANAILTAIRNYYMLFLLIGFAVTALGILIVRTVAGKGRKAPKDEKK